jgi:hypothetical protein
MLKPTTRNVSSWDSSKIPTWKVAFPVLSSIELKQHENMQHLYACIPYCSQLLTSLEQIVIILQQG